jgi:hypothetical protein
MVSSLIIALLLFCSPSAIVFGVAIVVVDPVDGVLCGRRLAHVGVEVLKYHPSLADGDSTAAVMHPVGPLMVGASLDHVIPAAMSAGSAKSPCVAVSQSCRAASTGFCRSATKTFPKDDQVIAAFASTEPVRTVPLPCLFQANGGQEAEYLTGDVCEVVSAPSRLGFSHDGTPNTRLVRTAMQLELRGRLYCSIVRLHGHPVLA